MDQKHRSLRFSDQVSVKTFETLGHREFPRMRTMARLVTAVPREDVTVDMLANAASLFSKHYGTWGEVPPGEKPLGKPGSRVSMSAARLRAQCLPEGSESLHVQIALGGVLAGHAFACRWKYQERQVLWITQLVVHSDFRERRLATSLLLNCLDDDDEVFGIMSSHPAACKALAKAFGDVPFAQISLDFAKEHAAGVIRGSPVQYIRDAGLCGRLFDSNDKSGMVLGVDSHFYVDHDEPLEALEALRGKGQWHLGDLPDGHEFLFLFERQQRRRSSSSHRSE
ncbi:Uncharacterized protein TPAR_05183 [Tolypocladium paradoxum]|uniref:N-acetyltransferase domain-containing protein n=1 Tax=Tolypocladium paradoxum TaxID=94208 RepID=A0A2S4KWR2_9HYPO|nr:Uncharacterized protein TPAR_05183 [Tolypocladium paradoxum]